MLFALTPARSISVASVTSLTRHHRIRSVVRITEGHWQFTHPPPSIVPSRRFCQALGSLMQDPLTPRQVSEQTQCLDVELAVVCKGANQVDCCLASSNCSCSSRPETNSRSPMTGFCRLVLQAHRTRDSSRCFHEQFRAHTEHHVCRMQLRLQICAGPPTSMRLAQCRETKAV